MGERFDAGAGLQYLNARYYDPKLGMFIQPDWFEVTMAGVGTNRYAYSFNDPVNLRDPNGNFVCGGGCIAIAAAAIGAFLASGEPANAPGPDDVSISQSPERTMANMVAGALVGAAVSKAVPSCSGACGKAAAAQKPTTDDQGSIVSSDDRSINPAPTKSQTVAPTERENKIHHIFGKPEHNMDALVDKYGSIEKAMDALDDAADTAYKSGKMNINKNGINSTTRINVGGIQVDILGGKVMDGRFSLGTASRRDIQ